MFAYREFRFEVLEPGVGDPSRFVSCQRRLIVMKFRSRRLRLIIRNAMAPESIARPPTTSPAMAPAFTELPEEPSLAFVSSPGDVPLL